MEGLLKGEKQKKQRSQNGRLLFSQGDGREQTLSIQEAKEIFKTARQVLQWSRKPHNWLGLRHQKQLSETLNSIGRCDLWNLLFYLQILLLMIYCVICSVSYISPGVNFGGSLPVEHPSGAPFHGSESSSVGEQCCELMWVSPCCLSPPALLPGKMRKAFNKLLSAVVLVTTPCLLTLLKYLYQKSKAGDETWRSCVKMVCLAQVDHAILLIFMCVTACLMDLPKSLAHASALV